MWSLGAVHLRLQKLQYSGANRSPGLIEDADSRNGYLNALKGRDGLSSPAVLALTAHIAAYEQGAPWLDALRAYLRDNLRYVADTLNHAFPELNWQMPQSTYLAWIDLRALNVDDSALQNALIQQEKSPLCPVIPTVMKDAVLSVSMPVAPFKTGKRRERIN